jgi:hypothetical protein
MYYRKTILRRKVNKIVRKILLILNEDENQYEFKEFCNKLREDTKSFKTYDSIEKILLEMDNNKTKTMYNINVQFENLSMIAETNTDLYDYLIDTSTTIE